MFEIKVPEFGESIQEVQVASWLKKPGDWVERDEEIVELESEKASQALTVGHGRCDGRNQNPGRRVRESR